MLLTLRSPGIRIFDGEAILGELRRIGSYQARELLTNSVDHEQITVRTVIPAETDVRASRLGVRCVDLENRR